MKDFQKDFTNKEKRELRKEFDNSSETRQLRKDLKIVETYGFSLLALIISFGTIPRLTSTLEIIIFISFFIFSIALSIKTYKIMKKYEKNHLEDYTNWLKEKNIHYKR